MKKIKIIFIGTGSIGVDLLQALSFDSRFEVILVVTGPDKPMGRKMLLKANEIKELANQRNLEVFQPHSINEPDALIKLKEKAADFFLVMAYGQMLGKELLTIPKIDCLNVHTSLLPLYRGASPIQSSLLQGDKKTGISLMKVIRKMDAGPIYQPFEHRINEEDSAGELSKKLATLAAKEVPEAIEKISEGGLTAIEQDQSKSSYCHKISKEDGQINWSDQVQKISASIRAFEPWPGSYTFFKGRRLKIISAKAHETLTEQGIGLVIKKGESIAIGGKNGFIEPIKVQLEGKKVQSMKEFLNGNQDFIGSKLK